MELLFPDPQNPAYANFLWEPSEEIVITEDEYQLPGITGPAFFRTNQLGVRGHEIPDVVVRKMAVLGGSTTECRFLDQQEAWPQVLQAQLFSDLEEPIWVGNFGKTGLNVNHHLLQTEDLIVHPVLREIEVLLLMPGYQEVVHFLAQEENEDKPSRKELIAQTFDKHQELSWWENSDLKKYIQQYFYKETPKRLNVHPQEVNTEILAALNPYLDNFEQQLKTIWKLTNQQNMKTIFITQPIGWSKKELMLRKTINPKSNEADWEKQQAAQFAQVLQKFNGRLRSICAENNFKLIDLDRAMPKDKRLFYDYYHFTEYGAEKAAQFVSSKIKHWAVF